MPWYPYPIQRQGVELLESLELSKARKFIEQWSSELLFLVIGVFHHEILHKIFGCGRAPGYLQQPICMDTGRLLIQTHNGCICCEIKSCEKKTNSKCCFTQQNFNCTYFIQNIVYLIRSNRCDPPVSHNLRFYLAAWIIGGSHHSRHLCFRFQFIKMQFNEDWNKVQVLLEKLLKLLEYY